MKFHVPDMSCGHCKASVEQAMRALDAGAGVQVDLSSRTVEVTTARAAAEVLAALDEIGFPAEPA